MRKPVYIVLALLLSSPTTSAATLETLKNRSTTLAPISGSPVSFAAIKPLQEPGRRLTREELEGMTDRELTMREMQLVREADAASLGEAYAYEEALVRIEEYTRTTIPDSDEAALANGILRSLLPFTRDVRTSGLTPREMARPDFLFSGPTQQSRFFALIDATFAMKFGRFRSMLGLSITDEQLARFGVTPQTRGLGTVLEALGSRSRDAWIMVFYADKRLERVRYTKLYDEVVAERKVVREILNSR